jgi:hypothetical protein
VLPVTGGTGYQRRCGASGVGNLPCVSTLPLAPCARSSDLTNSTPSTGGCSGSASVPTRPAGYTGDGLTGRLWNTASCLTAAPLTHSHAQLGIPETGSRADSGIPPAASRQLHSLTHMPSWVYRRRAHGPTLEYRHLPHGSSTHSLTCPAGYTGDGLTGRLWNTASCLTAAPLAHSLPGLHRSTRTAARRTTTCTSTRRRASGSCSPGTTKTPSRSTGASVCSCATRICAPPTPAHVRRPSLVGASLWSGQQLLSANLMD